MARNAKSKKKRAPKTVLKLPDLEQSKSAVLNSLTSPSSQRSYDHAIREFIDWYCSEPRLAFNKTVVTRYRISLLRHVFGRPPGRRTLVVDFAIAVRDWEHFHALKSLMKRGDFKPHPNKIHRLISNSTPAVLVDLIPFGGVEDADRTIAWPPDEDIVMKVIGFSDGLESAIPVRLDENLVIPVVSLPVLLILKLFAWVDRKHEKRDAVDIYTLMREYGDAGNEDRLYGESLNLLEAEGYDFEFAGARLLGSDAAQVISQDTRNRARAILESDSQMKELTNEIIGSSGRSDSEHFRRCELLVGKLRDGFLERV